MIDKFEALSSGCRQLAAVLAIKKKKTCTGWRKRTKRSRIIGGGKRSF